MILKKWKSFCGLCLCGILAMTVPGEGYAAEGSGYIEGVGIETSSSYKVKIDAPSVAVYSEPDGDAFQETEVVRGQIFTAEPCEDGWVRIDDGALSGYVRLTDGAILVEVTQEKVNEEAQLREQIVEYALQFVGGRYVWGGTDPHTGADCSGFTSYVMRQTAGVYLSHSSRAQAGEGQAVGSPKPGDLVFYKSGGSIDHVALYIGDGRIVHASNERNGIRISVWDYRSPAKIVDVLP